MTEGGGGGTEVPVPEQLSSGTPERWVVPNQATIDSPAGPRVAGINPIFKDVLTKEGYKIGQVLEAEVMANPGDTQTSLAFRFQRDPQGDYQVLTNGAQSWSSSVAAGKMNDKLVGTRSYQKSLGGETVPFYDLGPGKEQIPEGEGRSYGWVGFRALDPGTVQSRENLVLGVIPGFDSLEGIRFREEGDSIVVTVSKNLEGVSSQRPVRFKVFLGHARPERQETPSGKTEIVNQYADLMVAFSKELSKLVNIPLMKDRVIGFSWPVYAKEVTQADVEAEIAAGKGILDTYTIDAGWETDGGSLTVDLGKFPDLPGLVKQMKDLGIKPGIWVSPFMIKGKEASKLPPEWFMKDEYGRRRRIPLPGVAGLFERSFMLDISNPDVRKYLNGRLVDLAKMGFEVFKADFLMVPFTGQLQNKDKTSVEYYREFFEEFRQTVREQLGNEIEIIGCGAPLMESIGLFNGMRMTPDSTVPLETYLPFPRVLKRVLKPLIRTQLISGKTNTDLYHDTTAVGARRGLPFGETYGLIFDGIHMADKGVPLNQGERDSLNESIKRLAALGIGNLFVGDSMARVGEQGREKWRTFLTQFKQIALIAKLR